MTAEQGTYQVPGQEADERRRACTCGAGGMDPEYHAALCSARRRPACPRCGDEVWPCNAEHTPAGGYAFCYGCRWHGETPREAAQGRGVVRWRALLRRQYEVAVRRNRGLDRFSLAPRRKP